MHSYRKTGFGVSNNLSLFDIPSLEDTSGSLFLQRFKGKMGECPLFENGKYLWMEVKVVGYDPEAKQAIVHRLSVDDIKKVSRLSIRFSEDQQPLEEYWRRVNLAKKFHKHHRETNKFVRYVQSRA